MVKEKNRNPRTTSIYVHTAATNVGLYGLTQTLDTFVCLCSRDFQIPKRSAVPCSYSVGYSGARRVSPVDDARSYNSLTGNNNAVGIGAATTVRECNIPVVGNLFHYLSTDLLHAQTN